MIVFSKRMIPAILVVTWLTAGMVYAEMVDNPMYQHWARFKPGSYVTVKCTTKTGNFANESEKTYTLKKAVLETKTIVIADGNRTAMPPSTMDIPARVEKGKAVVTTDVKATWNVIGQGEEVMTIKNKRRRSSG